MRRGFSWTICVPNVQGVLWLARARAQVCCFVAVAMGVGQTNGRGRSSCLARAV